MNKDQVLATLNDLLEHELSGVVRYTHYSFMIFGHRACYFLRRTSFFKN